MPLSIVELKRICIEMGIIKLNPNNEREVPFVRCSLNKLYELILRITKNTHQF